MATRIELKSSEAVPHQIHFGKTSASLFWSMASSLSYEPIDPECAYYDPSMIYSLADIRPKKNWTSARYTSVERPYTMNFAIISIRGRASFLLIINLANAAIEICYFHF